MSVLSWYQHSSFKHKIGGLFVLLLSFLLVAIIYSITRIQAIEKEMREVAYLDIPLNQIMRQVEFIELEQHLQFEQFQLEAEQAKALKPHQQLAFQKQKLKQLLDRAMALISKSISENALQLDLQDRRKVAIALADYEQKSAQFEDKLSEVLASETDSALDRSQIEQMATELERSEAAILELLSQITTKDAYYTERHQKEFLFVNSALGFVAIILGLGLTFYIVQIFIKRIQRIQGEIRTINDSLEHGQPIPATPLSDLESKDELAGLEHEIQQVMLRLSDEITQREQVEKQLMVLATQDKLTGAYNRHKWDEEFERQIQLAKRGYQFSLIMIDVDHFKQVNDKHGHHIGDRLLKVLATLLTKRLRKSDLLFRLGGEEFAIILPMLDGCAARVLADELRKRVEQFRQHDLPSFTISLGVSAFHELDNQESLYRRADSALYEAKTLGRNQVVVK